MLADGFTRKRMSDGQHCQAYRLVSAVTPEKPYFGGLRLWLHSNSITWVIRSSLAVAQEPEFTRASRRTGMPEIGDFVSIGRTELAVRIAIAPDLPGYFCPKIHDITRYETYCCNLVPE